MLCATSYRQAQMLLAQRHQARGACVLGYAAAELHPLLREIILTAGKIAVDETTAPVLDPGRGRTKEGFFWAIARDDRPWGGAEPPAVASTYAPGRGAVHAFKLLDGYRGIVQCNGYAVYKTIKPPPLTKRSCWHFAGLICGADSSTWSRMGPAPIASEALERPQSAIVLHRHPQLVAISRKTDNRKRCCKRPERSAFSQPP